VIARTDRARLAFLTSTHVVDDLYQGAVPALLPFLAIERHYSYAGLTGITLAATFLASVVQPGFGALADKYRNLGWLVAAGLLVAGLGIGASGLGDNYLITWFAVAASGIGVAAYHPEATRTARGMAGDSTQAMSWFSVGGNLGIALGPVIVTSVLLVTRLPGTPLLALPAIVMAAVLAIRRPWRHDRGPGTRQAGRPRAAPGQADDWRGFGRLTVVVVLRSVAYFGVASLLALFAIRHFHHSAAVGSAALTAFIAAGVIGTLGGGWLADR
jgi:MFS transporter, FSR family, fosmidomycin resistance protein